MNLSSFTNCWNISTCMFLPNCFYISAFICIQPFTALTTVLEIAFHGSQPTEKHFLSSILHCSYNSTWILPLLVTIKTFDFVSLPLFTDRYLINRIFYIQGITQATQTQNHQACQSVLPQRWVTTQKYTHYLLLQFNCFLRLQFWGPQNLHL